MRSGLARTFIAACLWGGMASALAQAWPAKPVRIVVSFAAGGPTDVVARMLADKFSVMWKQPVVVENRAGAGGTIGSALIAKAAPDGYTLNLAASSHVYNGVLFGNVPYDPIKDFTPIAKVSYFPLLLVVHPSVTARSLKELVAHARVNPGKLSFGSSGGGTGSHLTAELFKRAAGIDILIVHYKGAAPATADLLGGRLHAMFDNPVSALPHVKSGKVHPMVTTGPKRSSALDYPTVADSGYPGFESGVWFAFIGPAGLPQGIVSKVAADVRTVLDLADVRQGLDKLGLQQDYSPPAELAASMRADLEKYSKVIREANIKVN